MQRRDFIKTTAAGALLPLAISGAAAQKPPQDQMAQNAKIKELRDRVKPVTSGERLQRQENARRLMTAQGIDALILEGGVSLNYFTGINWGRSERPFAMILPKNGDTQFIAPKFEESRARE